jgi:hypothetical protein
MNDQRIKNYVDEIFRGVKPGAGVTEQKEELVVNITERVQDYMREGLSFDAAFETAKNIVGDTDELTAPFEKESYGSQQPPEFAPAKGEPRGAEKSGGFTVGGKRVKVEFGWGIVALAPFLYVIIGLLQNWYMAYMPWFPQFMNWWAWGWIIIPGAAILSTKMNWTTKFVSLSPFIYLLLGFWFGFWAFGWIVIPIAGLIQGGIIKVTTE